MILDLITDWIVTVWEFIGLLFLAGSAQGAALPRDDDRKQAGASPTQRSFHHPHFA